VSFKDPRGQKILQQLAAKSDILVENYLPGTLEKYGLSYKQLSKLNPSLIYASITGYEQPCCLVWIARGRLTIFTDMDKPGRTVSVQVTM
jgi:crotonobetainyl-CoA:carnitine CoA-transferase CaiB-like acyl-CoA transferase